MPLYEAIRDSFGFRGQLWKTGDRFESEKGEKVPHHFQQIGGAVENGSKLEKFNVPQLKEMATELGASFPDNIKKADLIKLIEDFENHQTPPDLFADRSIEELQEIASEEGIPFSDATTKEELVALITATENQ